MKVYSIGREENCDIIIDDRTDVISRRHAALNVTSLGKMTIVDYSHNGNYVNGIRISPNVPVPVTRKDNISFAHVARLDWHVIPNIQAKIIRYVILGIVAILLVIGGVWGYKTYSGGSDTPIPAPQETVADTTATKPQEVPDSLKQKKDSVSKDIPKERPKSPPVVKPKNGHDKPVKEKDGESKQELKEESQTRFR